MANIEEIAHTCLADRQGDAEKTENKLIEIIQLKQDKNVQISRPYSSSK